MANIIITDDASFMRSSLKFIIETGGHKVVGLAVNGKELLKLYRQLKPDLVTLDILMEEMDGLQALETLRKEDPKAKVIMVTALGQEDKQKTAQKLGAAGYIRKPFKAKDINDEIARALGQKSE